MILKRLPWSSHSSGIPHAVPACAVRAPGQRPAQKPQLTEPQVYTSLCLKVQHSSSSGLVAVWSALASHSRYQHAASVATGWSSLNCALLAKAMAG